MKKEQPISGYPWVLFEITISNVSRERGSYFFILLSIMTRSNFTMIPIIDIMIVKQVNRIMIIS